MHPSSLPTTSVGLIGYGEVGKIFAAALQAKGAKAVSAWDRLFTDGGPGTEAGIQRCASLADLLARCDLVFSAVTASQTLAVARDAASLINPGTVFIDLNSASPQTKRDGAAAIEAAGGRYLEAAVMTSVLPYGIRVPMLLGGPHAQEMAPVLRGWGLDAKAASAELGTASAIKMCRSVVIKGLEAIAVESFHGHHHRRIACSHTPTIGFAWTRTSSTTRSGRRSSKAFEPVRQLAGGTRPTCCS
jgi:3-hydroxyisobutyrate dehydrogenase-like beta-hydroxyacid dehydrogenase